MGDKIGFTITDAVLTDMLQRSPRGFGRELAREIVARYTDQLRRALDGAHTYVAVVEALEEFARIRVHPPLPGEGWALADYARSADARHERQQAELTLWGAIARHERD